MPIPIAVLLLALATPAVAQTSGSTPGADPDSSQRFPRAASTPSTFGGALVASLNLLMIEHLGRVAFQKKTRRELGGNFFVDYHRSVRLPDQWGDTDGWQVNYFGHALHGAAAGHIWIGHEPEGRQLVAGWSKKYWASRARATGWAAFFSVRFEIGPLSEA